MASKVTEDLNEINLSKDMDDSIFVEPRSFPRVMETHDLKQNNENKLAAQEKVEKNSEFHQEESEEDRILRWEEKALQNKGLPFNERKPPKGFSTWSEYMFWSRGVLQTSNFGNKRRSHEVEEGLRWKEVEEYIKFGNNVTETLMLMPHVNVPACMADISKILRKYRFDALDEM
ncbi:hypothetical protein HHI36_008182 [Cryptolaemus montrouzieri]|uniref:Uncharacterized protein n=1 Tax=Cryptolaemus montrouzieri TaxID=559131 RepID=A0ABD2MRS9_9CUCU